MSPRLAQASKKLMPSCPRCWRTATGRTHSAVRQAMWLRRTSSHMATTTASTGACRPAGLLTGPVINMRALFMYPCSSWHLLMQCKSLSLHLPSRSERNYPCNEEGAAPCITSRCTAQHSAGPHVLNTFELDVADGLFTEERLHPTLAATSDRLTSERATCCPHMCLSSHRATQVGLGCAHVRTTDRSTAFQHAQDRRPHGGHASHCRRELPD